MGSRLHLKYLTIKVFERDWRLFVLIQSIAALVRVSEGDLRKAITLLQSAARLSSEKEISEHTIIGIAGVRHSCETWLSHSDYQYLNILKSFCSMLSDRLFLAIWSTTCSRSASKEHLKNWRLQSGYVVMFLCYLTCLCLPVNGKYRV